MTLLKPQYTPMARQSMRAAGKEKHKDISLPVEVPVDCGTRCHAMCITWNSTDRVVDQEQVRGILQCLHKSPFCFLSEKKNDVPGFQ